jgi:hypothetical protein
MGANRGSAGGHVIDSDVYATKPSLPAGKPSCNFWPETAANEWTGLKSMHAVLLVTDRGLCVKHAGKSSVSSILGCESMRGHFCI